jgi:hypothetical protein
MADFDLLGIVLFVISIILVMLILYLAVRVVTREEVPSAAYVVRLFLVALVIVIIVPLLYGFLAGFLGLGEIGGFLALIISFIILVVIMKYIIVAEVSLGNEWIESIVITILCIVFTIVFNAILSFFGQRALLSIF